MSVAGRACVERSQEGLGVLARDVVCGRCRRKGAVGAWKIWSKIRGCRAQRSDQGD